MAMFETVRGVWERRRWLRSIFVQNVASTLATSGLLLILAIGTSATIARVLGPEKKGFLALAILLPNMLSLFFSGGLNVANVYLIGSGKLKTDVLTANGLAFILLIAPLGTGLMALAYALGWLEQWLPGVPALLLILGVILFPIFLLNVILRAIFQGMQQIRTVNLLMAIQGGVTFLLTLFFLIGLDFDIEAAMLAAMVGAVISLLTLLWLLHRSGVPLRPRWRHNVMSKTLSLGLRGYVGNVLQFFNYRLDLFIINFFVGGAAAGTYTVSVAMAELLWYLPRAVGFVIFPKSSATRSEIMNIYTPRIFAATLGITLLGGIGLALVGPWLIGLVYGPEFSPAYWPLLALLPGVILLGGGKVLTNEIAGRGYIHYNSINAGLSLIITLTLDLLLIPRWGIMGAAVASSVAYATTFFTAIIFYARVSRP